LLDADSRRVRGRFWHIAATALALLALAGLGGCGGGAGNPSAGSNSGGWLSGTTKWFSGSKTIAVSPIVGAPLGVADDLTQALIVAGKDRNLTIVPSGSGEANYAMRGYLLANSEAGGTKVSYVWDVSDAKGARVVRISGEEMIRGRSGGDPWKKVDAAATRAIAGKTTSQLAASLGRGGRPSSPPVAATPEPARPAATAGAVAATSAATAAAPSQPRAATPVSTRNAGVLVVPVSGAPGDGQRSLPVALKKKLYAGGVKLANGPATNVYTVKGIVKMSNVSGGKENIRIDWQVLDPSGKKLGTVSQQNTIPRGSLNGPWGAIAEAAAASAADGILKLLPKSG
jgi:hypothetical protein